MIRTVGITAIALVSSLFAACGGAVLNLEDASATAVAEAPPAAGTATGFVTPLPGSVMTQGYGCTSLAIEPEDRSCPSHHRHTGVDFAAPAGTSVRATLHGVAQVIVQQTGYGLHVVIDHGDGLTSLYGHLATATVHDGDIVGAGDVIGTVGSTGNSTGPHLHFEIRRDGIPEDPTMDLPLP